MPMTSYRILGFLKTRKLHFCSEKHYGFKIVKTSFPIFTISPNSCFYLLLIKNSWYVKNANFCFPLTLKLSNVPRARDPLDSPVPE